MSFKKNNVPTIIQDRIIRIRDIYSIWINFPSKKEFELVQILISKYSISKSSAYDDLKIIKILLGSLNQTSQDFHRWRFNNWIEKTFDMAQNRKDARAMGSAAAYYAKYNNLDKIMPEAKLWDIPIQPFVITENPEVLGFKRIPNIEEKIKAKIRQYWNEDVETISYDEVDLDEEGLFKQKIGNEEE